MAKGNGLINRAATRKFILDKVAQERPFWPCTQVSAEALDNIEARLRAMIISMIQGHPTKGKTFKP